MFYGVFVGAGTEGELWRMDEIEYLESGEEEWLGGRGEEALSA